MRYILFILLVPLTANSGEKVEHVCGNGPHTVKVRVEDTKECYRPKPKLLPDDTYQQQDEICKMVPKWVDQEWSDWPECEGAGITDSICNNCLIMGDGNWTKHVFEAN